MREIYHTIGNSFLIAMIPYLVMLYFFKQNIKVVEDRTILFFAIVLAYIVLFGYNLPKRVNPNILH